MIKKTMNRLLAMIFLSCLVIFSGCVSREDESPGNLEDSAAARTPDFDTRLLVPSIHRAEAPERMELLMHTTKGDIRLEVTRKWAPRGVDRFYNLVKAEFFRESPFYRVNGTVAQFAYNGNPEVDQVWKDAFIPDDPDLPEIRNLKGFLTFAQDGPGKRNTQLFFNLRDNEFLDGKRFPPIGRVISGLEVLDSLYDGYGEGAPVGNGPLFKLIYTSGNPYLKRDFPNLDYILGIEIVE